MAVRMRSKQNQTKRNERKSIDKFDALWHCLVPHISPKNVFQLSHNCAICAASSGAEGLYLYNIHIYSIYMYVRVQGGAGESTQIC